MALNKYQRRARKAFAKRYSRKTVQIVRYTIAGWSTWRIANKLNMNPRSVSTTRGNYTRGLYTNFCKASGLV